MNRALIGPTAVLAMVFVSALLLAGGCSGGGGGGITPIDNNNQNGGSVGGGNQNPEPNDNSDPSDDQNANGNGDVAELGVEISGLPPSNQVEVGQDYALTAVVTGQQGEPSFEWQMEKSSEVAALSTMDEAETILSILDAGLFTLVVSVSDDVASASSEAQVSVAGDEPPPEAELILLVDILVQQPGDFVALIADTDGPIPQSISWAADPINIIAPLDFVDFGDGTATFTVPFDFAFPYVLIYTVTATYEQGSLSDSVEILIN